MSASIHLSLPELELGDLAFGLAIGPLLGDGSLDGVAICGDTAGEVAQ